MEPSKNGIGEKMRFLKKESIVFISMLLIGILYFGYDYLRGAFDHYENYVVNDGPNDFLEGSQFSLKEITIEDVSITYPKDWIFISTPQGNHGDLDVIAGLQSLNVNNGIIISKKIFRSKKFEEVISWGEQRVNGEDNFSQLSSVSFSIQNQPARIIEYTYSSNTFLRGVKDFHCYQVDTIISENGYDITLCSSEEDWKLAEPIYRKIINSIKFVR